MHVTDDLDGAVKCVLDGYAQRRAEQQTRST